MIKISDQELNDIINKISFQLADKFKFGSFDRNDIKQQISILVLDALPRFNKDRGTLINFLYSHCKKRLINFRRDFFERKDQPCFHCPLKAWDKKNLKCKKFQDMKECHILSKWQDINDAKRNLAGNATLNESMAAPRGGDSSVLNGLEDKELLNYIDEHLPVRYRKDYVMLLYGFKLSTSRRNELMFIVKDLISKYE